MLTPDEILDRYINQSTPPKPKVPDPPKIKDISNEKTDNCPNFLKVELEKDMYQWTQHLTVLLNINGDKVGIRRVLRKEDKFRYEETASILASELLNAYKATLEKLILTKLYQLNPPHHANSPYNF